MTPTLPILDRLRLRADRWKLNSNKAWVNTPLADIREAADLIERQAEVIASLSKALSFYGDVSKYPAPLTGGMGDLWQDCGERARAALLSAKTLGDK